MPKILSAQFYFRNVNFLELFYRLILKIIFLE